MTESMKYYESIRRKYPEAVSKDQFYQIAHISKATALHLLQNGLVPCKDTGKKTRRYTIRTDDIIFYLIDREIHPEVYRAPDRWYQERSGHYNSRVTYRNELTRLSEEERASFRKYMEDEFCQYGDLLTIVEVAEAIGYTALIGYIWYEAPDHEKNFTTLLEMINASEAREDDETFKNPVDVMFDELEARDPDHFAVKQYRKYKLAAGKTAKSILISCGARLAPFDIAELRELMSYDEMELDTIGDRKTALFVIISDTDDTFNFVVAIMYSQLFNLLCDKADDVYNGRLPVHVRCLLDEFANIGQIPKFDKLIATIRSREISASIILQSQSQLKTIYKDAADTITGNCDCTLFLGGKEKSTLKEISEVLGKETIDLYNTSETRSNNNSYGLNYQKTGKELMSQDEIAVMDGAKSIIVINPDSLDVTRE